MKKSSLIVIVGIVIGMVCLYQLRLANNISVMPGKGVVTDTTTLLPTEGLRPSIAFILGEDKEADNPYYQEALRYYSTHPKGKTDFVVTTCRSLEEVKFYLSEHAVMNAQPWGDIHLVSHGNQWNGLSVKVAPDSKRATTERILEYTQRVGFEFLPSSVVDDMTRIFLNSCGIGNNEPLVDAVKVYFGCPQSVPTVYAPRLFVFYTSDATGKNSQKYLAENWMINYRFGERPSSFILMNNLREKYKDAPIDWSGALDRRKPRWIGDTYHYTFDVPVKWVVPVDSVPTLATDEQQTKWLNNQDEIVCELERLHLPIEKFKWTFTNGYSENKDGVKKPAVGVKGYCTMLCIVKALMDSTENTATSDPGVPEIINSKYYYKTTAPLLANIDQ